jgi:hypothetical protein
MPVKDYQLRIVLKQIVPDIWRRVVVPGNVTLAKLHKVIQLAMGWQTYHLYLFTVGPERYGEDVGEWSDFDQRVSNAKRTTLQDVVVRKGARFLYEYDMGDGWEHEIAVEAIEESSTSKVRCLGGSRSCPPEDCGGPYGYEELLEIIFDPQHPQYEDRKAWLGDGFGPEEFDLPAINRRLGRLKV